MSICVIPRLGLIAPQLSLTQTCGEQTGAWVIGGHGPTSQRGEEGHTLHTGGRPAWEESDAVWPFARRTNGRPLFHLERCQGLGSFYGQKAACTVGGLVFRGGGWGPQAKHFVARASSALTLQSLWRGFPILGMGQTLNHQYMDRMF